MKVVVSLPPLSLIVLVPVATVRRRSRAVKLTRIVPLAGPLICTTSSRPRSVSLRWIVAFGVGEPPLLPDLLLELGPSPEPWPLPEPEPPDPPLPELPAGTVRIVCAAAAAVPLPAALVSHTARFQLPGPGTVTVAGPAAGDGIGALQDPEPLAGQTW